jgi:hypothetical protein
MFTMMTSTDTNTLNPSTLQMWTREGFIISTDPALLSTRAVNAAFAAEWTYWAKPLPEPALKTMLSNSLCFGLYMPTPGSLARASTSPSLNDRTKEEAQPIASRTVRTGNSTTQIGFARIITDSVTFAYLTDVYVLPEWKGVGLGRWLVECVCEVLESMPYLRRSMLITTREGPVARFYEDVMGMERMDRDVPGRSGELCAMSARGRGNVA